MPRAGPRRWCRRACCRTRATTAGATPRRGPDGKLYVAIGAPCNICAVKGFEGTIVRLRPDGHELEIFARGVRNSVGFDWHPADRRDVLHRQRRRRPRRRRAAGRAQPRAGAGPALRLSLRLRRRRRLSAVRAAATRPGRRRRPRLRSRPMAPRSGSTSTTAAMFPEDYRNDALLAEHGSWNRSEPVGYRIMRVRFSRAGQPQGQWVFIDGWLGPDGSVSRPPGRPRGIARRLAADLRRPRRPDLPRHLPAVSGAAHRALVHRSRTSCIGVDKATAEGASH